MLTSDPGTQITAALGEWEYPTDRNTAVLQDLFDRQTQLAGAKAQPYPRGWKIDKRNVDHHGGKPISAGAALLRLRPTTSAT